MGGVTLILTRGMDGWLMDGIPACYCVLVEHLGGLFFDGRRSCTKDSFVGRSGLYHSKSFVVNILVCV